MIGSGSNSSGIISASGIRNSTCLVRLRKIDLPAMPMEVKKLPATIWNPTSNIDEASMRIGRTVCSISTSSWVNSRTIHRGTISPSRNTQPITIVAHTAVNSKARNMRSYRRAP